MSSQTQPAFGKWRSVFWPIHLFELKKFLPMCAMMFFINFNYTILRDMKDSLVVTATGSGAEAIPFLKVWGVLPVAILLTLGYSKLSNILNKPRLFYTTIAFFITFFTLFALVLYPLKDYLHPTEFADKLQATLPQGFSGLIAILRNWTFSLFYIMSELWGSMILSLAFWTFANDITKISESKRFYAMFAIGANAAMPLSGWIITYFSDIRSKYPAGVDTWGMTINYLTVFVVAAGLLAMFVYSWMQKNVLTDARFYDPSEIKKGKKEKPKMSLGESFRFLAKSPYLGCIAMLVIGYGISINLVEVTWKSQLKLQYPNANDYNAFMGRFSMMTGIATILMIWFAGGNVIRRFGWGVGAMITPTILLITGVGFFSFIMFKDSLTSLVAFFQVTPLMLAVLFGTAQNIFTKSAKYTLFDPTKEMAYIPLDQESKVKGKAVVDVVGARLGKSGGAFIQQVLLILFGTISAITPYIAGILGIIVFGWLTAARALNKRFTELTAAKEKEAAAPASHGAAPAPAAATAQTTSSQA